MIYLSEFQCPPSKRRGLDQTGSQTCLICSQQRSFYKFKFLGLTPDHCKQGLCRWWKNRHLSLKSFQLPVKINDIWTLLEGRRTPVSNQLWLARTRVHRGNAEEHLNWKHQRRFSNTRLPGSGRLDDRGENKIRISFGGDSGTCLWNSPGYGEYYKLSEPLLLAGF